MADAAKDAPLSSGVDALIAKLRDEGVSAGRAEAEKIVSDAKATAERILSKARAEADQHLSAARKEADAYRQAGEEALKTAMRDAVLEMKAGMMQKFGADVKRLVSHHMQDPEILKSMILAIAGRVREGAGLSDGDAVDIILPANVIGIEELRQNPEELGKGQVTGFVLGLTGDMLREGVTFRSSDDMSPGIRVEVKDKDIVLDVSEEAVAGLLLQHLQPRFRAILEGIVK